MPILCDEAVAQPRLCGRIPAFDVLRRRGQHAGMDIGRHHIGQQRISVVVRKRHLVAAHSVLCHVDTLSGRRQRIGRGRCAAERRR